MNDFLNPHGKIHMHGWKLPHWQQGEVMQFITFRLGDALPQGKLALWRREKAMWLQKYPQPWSDAQRAQYYERFTGMIEGWLDEGMGRCLLRDPVNREILGKILWHDHGRRVTHEAWVLMPNHVHLLFKPHEALDVLIKDWKSISARWIGNGPIWQKNYRDTLIRDARRFAAVVHYILRNPRKLQPSEFSMWLSERAQTIS